MHILFIFIFRLVVSYLCKSSILGSSLLVDLKKEETALCVQFFETFSKVKFYNIQEFIFSEKKIQILKTYKFYYAMVLSTAS